MKNRFLLPLITLAVLSLTTISCKKELTRGGGGSSSSGPGIPGTTSNVDNTIASNFNGTAIPAGRNVWVNAHFKLSTAITVTTVIHVTNAYLYIPVAPNSIAIPDATVTYDAATTTASAVWTGSTWDIHIPLSSANQNVFFGGAIFVSDGLPGGMNPVDFTATFSGNYPGINFDWQWSAACFNTTMDPNLLNVSPVDAAGTHAGAPNGYNGFAVGGARGGGAADLTGSWSGTGHVLNAY